MLILRPYQDAAKSAVYQHLRTREDNPCVVIPTGGGKTPLLASIRTDAVRQWVAVHGGSQQIIPNDAII